MENKKQLVKVRSRNIVGGSKSLYLDIAWNGLRKREFLKLYITPGKSPMDRAINRETTQLAETIRSKRQIELQSTPQGVSVDFKSKVAIIAYIEYFISLEDRSNNQSYQCVVNNLRRYGVNRLEIGEVTTDFIEDFQLFLKTTDPITGKSLAINSINKYMICFKAVMNYAVKKDVIYKNPFSNFKILSTEDTHRSYLTIEELRKMAQTDCEHPELKRMFIFSSLTGLRWSDINALTWNEVIKTPNGFKLDYRQVKTGNYENLDLNSQAISIIGESGSGRIFRFDMSNPAMRAYLKKWVVLSGITKHITFHSARHTFATLQLEYGTDIFTVSKLLGHRSIKTTQIYSHIMNKAIKEAVDRMPDIGL